MIRFRFHLTLCSTQGFCESLIQLIGLGLQVPDYSTLSRKLEKCEIQVGGLRSGIFVILEESPRQKKSGYPQGFLSETDMYRLKTILGETRPLPLCATTPSFTIKENQGLSPSPQDLLLSQQKTV